jgi:hypothetical protein
MPLTTPCETEKENSRGTYRWHTFHGSARNDYSYALATDETQNLHVAGNAEEAWNGPNGQAPLNAHSGNNDLFVFKLQD